MVDELVGDCDEVVVAEVAGDTVELVVGEALVFPAWYAKYPAATPITTIAITTAIATCLDTALRFTFTHHVWGHGLYTYREWDTNINFPNQVGDYPIRLHIYSIM